MKQIYFRKQGMLSALLITASMSFAQVQLNMLEDFGTGIFGINNHGKGIHGNGYYDFSSNTSSMTESNVVETSVLNEAGQILGLLDDGEGNYLPALKTNDTWNVLNNFDLSIDYRFYGLSQNGKYAVGQTLNNETFESWPFIYNIETETLSILSSELYEYGAGYDIDNNGIGVGWMDDLAIGTHRMPAFFNEYGEITLLKTDYGEANGINDQQQIVGTIGSNAFIYNLASNEFQTLTPPPGFDQISFSDISDNNVSIGFAQTYIVGQGFSRSPIIYHHQLSPEVILLTDKLSEYDIDITSLDGTAYKISSDGNYIGGWGNGPGIFAIGWAINFDNQLLNITDLTVQDFSFYPNPVQDVLNLKTSSAIHELSIYNLTGQELLNHKQLKSHQINLSGWAAGIYVGKVTFENGHTKTFKIIKK